MRQVLWRCALCGRVRPLELLTSSSVDVFYLPPYRDKPEILHAEQKVCSGHLKYCTPVGEQGCLRSGNSMS